MEKNDQIPKRNTTKNPVNIWNVHNYTTKLVSEHITQYWSIKIITVFRESLAMHVFQVSIITIDYTNFKWPSNT